MLYIFWAYWHKKMWALQTLGHWLGRLSWLVHNAVILSISILCIEFAKMIQYLYWHEMASAWSNQSLNSLAHLPKQRLILLSMVMHEEICVQLFHHLLFRLDLFLINSTSKHILSGCEHYRSKMKKGLWASHLAH